MAHRETVWGMAQAGAWNRSGMTDSAMSQTNNPRITVLPVEPGNPPYRLLEIDGEIVGTARAMTDVLVVAAAAGIRIDDLDDPDQVRWMGGDKLTWKLHGT